MTRAPPLPVSALCLLTALAAFAASGAAFAASGSGGSLAQRYQRTLQSLEESRANEDKTRAERDVLADQARDLQEQLVANAAKVQEIEASYADTRTELETLNGNLQALESDLDKDRGRVAQLLAVLQRLDADEPPALAVRPDDSLAAARSAMQLGAVLPPVYAEAAALAKRLSILEETRNAQAAKVAEGESQAEALRQARSELDRLLQLRNQEQQAADLKLTELHGITQEIAKASGDLKGLMDRVASLRESANPTPGMHVVTPARSQGGTLAKGSLRVPVIGRFEAGDPSGPGAIGGTQSVAGLWFEGTEGAEAVSPADSIVVFAGPYQKFGQVLILEIIGGYHLTLAGLGRIDVQIGDRVLAGEPVGALPQGMPARLYLELRRNGQAVDPAPWLGAELRKAKGS
jgi:septal ring factor EnvC (AmiA/AmiB activator)